IIAALADAVVVVESPESGGAMHTVDEALRRDRPVLAVPGPVTSHASAGTNRLLRDVAVPCCDVDDVLLLLGITPNAVGAGGPDRRPPPSGAAAAVLTALGWTPATLDHVVGRSGLGLGEVALALETLVADGWVVVDGPWFERVTQGRGVRR
nr:DNA-processing protein DprA [Acidimicrobiia bacterium]